MTATERHHAATRMNKIWCVVWIAALVASCIGGVSGQQVAVETTPFDNLPDKFFYFKDSEIILWLDAHKDELYRSEDNGKQWSKVTDGPSNSASFLYEHPFDNDKAYVLSRGKTHWKTSDKGKTWKSFESYVEPASSYPHLSFHAERSNYVLFHGFKCKIGGWTGVDCHEETYYTLNNFEELTLLRTHTSMCLWSLSSPKFENVPVKEVMCIESTKKSGGLSSLLDMDELRLIQSEDFFHTEQAVDFGTGRAVDGVIAASTINQFMVAAVKPSSLPDMDLYTSLDGENWHEAVFPEGAKLHEKAYTIVESKGPSLLVDVLDDNHGHFGTLYKSNSNGTFFVKSLENTNRNPFGIIDFERVQGVEGVMIANVVSNVEQVERGGTQKDIQTRMSFDDGATWRPIQQVKKADGTDLGCRESDCSLHMHSVTSPHNLGQVFTSNSAVGVMMGVGNYGKRLLEYDECDTFLSTDGGLSWKMVREGAHMYEFGDMGALLVLADDEKETDHVWWSKDRGNTWERLDLGVSIRARILTTDPKSTSRSFVLVGGSARSSESPIQSIHLDFSAIHARQCELKEDDEQGSDFEKWFARDLTDGPDCLMGHEQMYYRRKADRDCYVGHNYQDPVLEMKECPCTESDYECDYNFIRDANGGCTRIGPDLISGETCASRDAVYPGSSGYRLIPGNNCDANGGVRLDEPKERKCGENMDMPTTTKRPQSPQSNAQPSDDTISKYQTVFDDEIDQFVYFKDSSSMLLRLRNGELWWTEEHGIQWVRVLEEDGFIHRFVMHEFDNTRAYAITEKGIHMTDDQGKHWMQLQVPATPSRRVHQPLDFHPLEKDWLLFVGRSDTGHQTEAYVSRNNGGSWDALDLRVEKCIFGRDAKYEIQKETIYCSAFENKDTEGELQLIRTVDWGRSKEVLFNSVVEFFVIDDFMAVASSTSGDLALYVSVDGHSFSEAQFPPDQYIDRNTFTVLQSSTHAVLLNIFKSVSFSKAHGALYKSNENGTFYHLSLDNTNGNANGFVDFEKMQSLDGIILANQVTNADELIGSGEVPKKIRTMISWDDGGHWQPLAPPHNFDCSGRDCTLNLHSRTDIRGPGAIFTSSGAPGLAMGVGSVGPSLLPYEQSNTFLTRDAGHSWVQIQEGEHLYEFGDHGSILLLINDEGPTNELLYSWDQGETWHFYQFAKTPIRVSALTTDPKSTTLRFVIVGHTRDTQRSQVAITVDFAEAKQRHCELNKNDEEKSDFERWIPKDDDGDDACLLGKKTAYWRRKKDRVCIVANRFTDPEVVVEKCECRDTDFECDFGFWRNEKGECSFLGRHPDRPAQCKPEDKFRGRSGYRKNAKTTCEGGLDLEKEKEWECGQGGDIQSRKTDFSDRILDYIYFTDTDRVFIRTADNKVWRSDNDGYSWKDLFPGEKIVAMYQNPYHEDRAYFITDGDTHYVTQDKGSNVEPMTAPLPPVMNIQGTVLNFHKEEPDYLLYLGESGCDTFFSSDCHSEAYYSRDNGRMWHSIGTYMRSCFWGRSGAMDKAEHDALFCEQYHEKSGNQRSFFANPLELVSTSNFFNDQAVLFEDIVGVTTFGKFMVVAASKNNGANLRLHISLDGTTFAPATFPASFDLSPEAFTIMESANSMWIHVTTNSRRGGEYGNILTSNSNGTYFVLSLENANRNEGGIVDFEKMQGIEGIALANKVSNPNQANMGDPKKLVTVKTVDAGRSWSPLTSPETDSEGKKYNCRGEECSLHLHAYSERRNTRDLFSSSSAVGLMVGVGNVGPSLTPYRDGDMFLTRDAGKTWFEVHKGAHIWEFADQGALLILVDDEEPTNMLRYTTNEGLTWKTYEFAKKGDRLQVEDIITQPDGTSQKYILFGTERSTGQAVAYHIDFSAIHPTKCKLDVDHPDDDDFELWSPEDTRGETCLFGRETKYYRRIRDRDCYIGEKLIQPREVVRNCSCTIADYECDFNYVRDANDKCVLVPGLAPLQPVCDGTVDYVYAPTGYRRIAASTCEGGEELDKTGDRTRCPGRGSSGGLWAVFVFTPIGAAALVFACLHFRKHGRFGRIRLSDASQTSQNLLSHPFLTKVVASAVVIPVALVGLLSRISVPRSIPGLDFFRNLHIPFLRRGRSGYNPVSQDDYQTDVLLDDYDAREEDLFGAEDEDADEL